MFKSYLKSIISVAFAAGVIYVFHVEIIDALGKGRDEVVAWWNGYEKRDRAADRGARELDSVAGTGTGVVKSKGEHQ